VENLNLKRIHRKLIGTLFGEDMKKVEVFIQVGGISRVVKTNFLSRET